MALHAAKAARPGHQLGFSLVELMVALVAGLIFAISVLLVQAALTRQNVQMSDTLQRDNQARAALDLLTRDLSNAGFMLGGQQARCDVLLAYDSGLPVVASQTFGMTPVTAASQPVKLPTSTAVGSSSYPTGTPDPNAYGTSTQFTDLIAITGATSALQPTSASNASGYVVQNSTTQSSSGQGALNSGELPLGSTAGISVGDTLLLRMPLNGKLACFRVPVVGVGPSTSPSSTYIKSKGSTLFPSTAYAAFNPLLIANGVLPSGGSLSNANFTQSRLTDLGPSTSSNLQTIIYYIGNATYANSGGATFPMLMRAVLNAQTDALVSVNPVAAGVVSLQALFGVDESNSGAVTNYLTWPDVVAGNYQSGVRSVLFALVTRTLHADPKYTAPATIAIASPSGNGGAGPDAFTPYTVPTGFANFRYSVLESEIAVRNSLWPH